MKTTVDTPRICQYDGNDTLDTISLYSGPSCACCDTLPGDDYAQDQELEPVSIIPVLVTSVPPSPQQDVPPPPWYDEYHQDNTWRPQSSRITVKRDNRLMIKVKLL